MSRPPALLLTFVLLLLCAAPVARAQDAPLPPPPAAQTNPSPATETPPTATTQSAAPAEGAAPATSESSDPAAASDAAALSDSTAGPVPGANAARQLLVRELGLAPGELDNLERIESLRADSAREREARAGRIIALESEAAGLARLGGVLERQVASDRLGADVRVVLGFELVSNLMARAVLDGERAAVAREQTRATEVAVALDALRDQHVARKGVDPTSVRRIEQAEANEQRALAALEEARVREQAETNQQIRALLARERELTEELLTLTREENEQLRRLIEARRERARAFDERRLAVQAELDELPSEVREATARQQADPLFDRLIEERRRARASRREHATELEVARDQAKKAHEVLAAARAELAQTRERVERLEASELGRRQLALAELQVTLNERKAQIADDLVEARAGQVRLDHERVAFFNESVERVLVAISGERRSRHFSLFRDENWHDALDGLREAGDWLLEASTGRVEQFLALPARLWSASFWGWMIGFFMRLLLFPLAFWLGREYGPQLVRRLVDALLKQRVFRQYPAATIKFAEILRALIKPLMLYVALVVILDYLVPVLPEMRLPRWAMDAVVIYWAVLTALQVLVLPRGYREQTGTPSPDLEGLGAESGTFDGFIDVVHLEITRAQKLIKSVRIVLIFWLLARYVPEIVLQILGHSVLWYIVDRVFTFGFIAVFYSVISTWKDEIASLFERLAQDRLPRSVTFVKTHKNRPYGVLIIGLASFYVAGREAARLGRAWFVDTRWSRQVANFIFQKKIELQTRERPHVTEGSLLTRVPDSYRALFADTALSDEPFRVVRTQELAAIDEVYQTWKNGRRRGSVAVVGEAGIGKSTLLNQLHERMSAAHDGPIVHLELVDKLTSRQEVLEFVARVFELEEVPPNRNALVEELRRLPPRMLIFDNCHNMFVRKIGGFEPLDLFLEVVHRCDGRHFWVMSFNRFAWSYLNRVMPRQHYFGAVTRIEGWSESDIQQLIRQRDARSGLSLSFSDLMVAHETADRNYEVIKTSNGYFRLLHEFSRGNPRVALTYWLRSIKPDERGQLHVNLFHRPPPQVLQNNNDQYLFSLAAIAQHGSLRPDEIAEIINAERGFCEMVIDYFTDSDVTSVDERTGRARLTALYYRMVLRQLIDSNFIYE